MAGYMREARVGLVTPLRDGMNLVAKEYVAAQDPQDPGVLILSRFAGAARQLEAAVLVNPNDIDDLADALDRALRMRLDERQDRWQSLWLSIADASPLNWGRSFIAALLRAALVGDAPGAGRRGVRSGRRQTVAVPAYTAPSFGALEVEPEPLPMPMRPSNGRVN